MGLSFGKFGSFLKNHVGDIVSAVMAAAAIGGSNEDKKAKAVQFAGLGMQIADPLIANHPKVKSAEDAVIEAVVALAKAHQEADATKTVPAP